MRARKSGSERSCVGVGASSGLQKITWRDAMRISRGVFWGRLSRQFDSRVEQSKNCLPSLRGILSSLFLCLVEVPGRGIAVAFPTR